MTFGERILKTRTQKGLTQSELAKSVGYKSRSTIAKIEAGERDVPQTMIVALAKALDVTPTYLMGWDEETNVNTESNIKTLPNNKVTESDIKFALFGDTNVDDEVLEDVMRYARIARQMREDKQNKD